MNKYRLLQRFLPYCSNVRFTKKGVSRWAFIPLLLMISVFFTGCDEGGIVGGGFEAPENQVDTTVVNITNIQQVSENGFSGRLMNSAFGKFDDPDYGNLRSVALLKPSINTQNITQIGNNSTIRLRVELNSLRYGNSNTPSEFSVYEVDQNWRGNQLLYNQEVSFDETELIGEFQVNGDEEYVEVPLSEEWVERYRAFFNNSSEDRVDNYRSAYNGFAIVPSDQNEQVHFMRHQRIESDTTTIEATRLLIDNSSDIIQVPDDSLNIPMPMFDWGSSFTRNDIPDQPANSFVIHNTLEEFLEMKVEIDPDQFRGKNIVNAQLLLFVNNEPDNALPPEIERPKANSMRMHIFTTAPVSLHSEIFTRQAVAVSAINESENFYQLNITDVLLNRLYGDQDNQSLYFSLQTLNGLLYSSSIYNQNGPSDRVPRLIITSVNAEN